MHIDRKSFPESLNPADSIEAENRLEEFAMEITLRGNSYRPLLTQQGIVFIESAHLEPIASIEEPTLCERVDTDGKVYIAAKRGLEVRALLLPRNILTDTLATQLETIAHLCCDAQDIRKEARTW